MTLRIVGPETSDLEYNDIPTGDIEAEEIVARPAVDVGALPDKELLYERALDAATAREFLREAREIYEFMETSIAERRLTLWSAVASQIEAFKIFLNDMTIKYGQAFRLPNEILSHRELMDSAAETATSRQSFQFMQALSMMRSLNVFVEFLNSDLNFAKKSPTRIADDTSLACQRVVRRRTA